jgi:hypothetical protein
VVTPAEQQHRCERSPGPVGNGEVLAHYLSSDETFDRAEGAAKEAAFKTNRLLGKDNDRSEECGESWGESMHRMDHTPPETMKARALAFGSRAGQQPAPVALVSAAEIRDITLPAGAPRQLLQLLDDGSRSDPGHVVLRACDGVKKAEVTEARRQLLKKLSLVELTDAPFSGPPEAA